MSNQFNKIPEVSLNDGNSLPLLGIGTSNSVMDSYTQVKNALRLGMRHIDVTGSEELIGIGHAITDSEVPRADVFITARVPFLANLNRAIGDTLLSLSMTYIDFFLMEREPYQHDWQLSIAWSAMEEIKVDGQAKSIGVANMRKEDLAIIVKKAKRFLPVVNRVEFHPFCPQSHLLQWSKLHGISTATYGPLDSVFRKAAKEVMSTHPNNIFRKAAVSYNVTVPAVILKWIALSGVAIVTTRTKPPELEAQLKMFHIGLTNNEFEAIAAAGLHKLKEESVKRKEKAEQVGIKEEEGVKDENISAKKDEKNVKPGEAAILEDVAGVKQESCVRKRT